MCNQSTYVGTTDHFRYGQIDIYSYPTGTTNAVGQERTKYKMVAVDRSGTEHHIIDFTGT